MAQATPPLCLGKKSVINTPDYRIVQTLVMEEIRRLVAEAIRDSGICVSAGRAAIQIARAYPNSGMSPDQISEEIVTAAIQARVNVEITKPRHETFPAAV